MRTKKYINTCLNVQYVFVELMFVGKETFEWSHIKFCKCIQRLFLLFKIFSGGSKWELFLYLLSSDLWLISENSSEVSLLSWGAQFFWDSHFSFSDMTNSTSASTAAQARCVPPGSFSQKPVQSCCSFCLFVAILAIGKRYFVGRFHSSVNYSA